MTLAPPAQALRHPHRRWKRLIVQTAPDESRSHAGQAGGAFVAGAEIRMLVIDDDPVFNEMLPRSLQRAIASPALRIVAAASPEDAFRLANEHRPDVVLCDYDLRASEDGVDVLRKLAAAHPHAMRILVSGHARRDIPGYDDAPVDAFLDKPMRLLDLVPRLVHLLETRFDRPFELRD